MAAINELNLILHRIRVKLYPNYLPKVEGAYVARTDNEKTLTQDDVCSILKTRAGFSGHYEDLLDYVNQYQDEVAYQLCDGFAVTNGYYTIHPNIGGTFNSVNEAHDHAKHPITFRFGARAKLRRLAKNIAVDIEGIADTGGYIDTFTDEEEGSVNGICVQGNMCTIHGSKIKIDGDESTCGVFFVPVDDPAAAVKMTRIGENTPVRITGIVPQINSQFCRIEIRTQFSGVTGKPLKSHRVITSAFVLEEA
jgi:hypothetical protein